MGAAAGRGKVDFARRAAQKRLEEAHMSYLPFPDIAPELFSVEIAGVTFALRWYALAYVAGIVIGWRILVLAVTRPALWGGRAAPMTAAQVDDLITWIILGVVLGGRIGYVLVYSPGGFLEDPLAILRLWEGGMSFHGGFVGVVAASWIWARRNGVDRGALADALALATPPGLLLGRIANFVNAELWGRPTELPWGVAFPGAAAQDCPGVEGICARHPSQLYEAGLEGLVLGFVLWILVRRGALALPGLVLGVFLAGYGAARIFVEMFRVADAQFVSADNPLGHVIGLGPVGLSMGQLLSLPMVVAGLWFVARATRAPRVS
jgi:phosphatidylglycerol:prolipoprotein diacylglycerol transferase